MGDSNPAQGNEACMTEGDKFVGTTAKFGDHWEIIPLGANFRPKK